MVSGSAGRISMICGLLEPRYYSGENASLLGFASPNRCRACPTLPGLPGDAVQFPGAVLLYEGNCRGPVTDPAAEGAALNIHHSGSGILGALADNELDARRVNAGESAGGVAQRPVRRNAALRHELLGGVRGIERANAVYQGLVVRNAAVHALSERQRVVHADCAPERGVQLRRSIRSDIAEGQQSADVRSAVSAAGHPDSAAGNIRAPLI